MKIKNGVLKTELVDWRELPGYEGIFEISNTGEIKSLSRFTKNGHNRGFVKKEYLIIKQINNSGYYRVYLRKGAVQKWHYIHRLVAQVFIPNIDNKKCINHKNGIKLDNSVSNLEWATHSENLQHAYDTGLRT